MTTSKKNMVIFLLGKLVSLFGTHIYSFAMGLYILKITGSAMNFGISILLGTVPRLILGPIGGVISDKFDRKKIVLLTDFFSGIVMFLAFGLSLIFGLSIWIIYGSTLLLASLNTLFSTSFDAAMPNLVADESLKKINSYNQAINSLSGIIGPLLGGFVYALISPELFILANGISFILSTFSESLIDFYWKVEKRIVKTSLKETRFIKDIKEGFSYIKKTNNLLILIEGALVINFLFTAITVAIPHLLVVQFSISERSFGIIESAGALGSLTLSIIIANKVNQFNVKKVVSKLIAMAGIVFLYSIPVLPFSPSILDRIIPIYYGIIYFMFGGIIVLVNIPIIVYIQEIIKDEFRGRVMSLIVTISAAISPLGYLIHGILLDIVPTYIIMIYVGIGLFLISIVMLTRFKNEEKENNIKTIATIEEPASI